jgi:predicted Zn-dependent protease
VTVADDIILSAQASRAIADRVKRMVRGPGTVRVGVSSQWTGDVRWARNRVSLAGDARDINVRITRVHRMSTGTAETSLMDDAGLEAAVRQAEIIMRTQTAGFELIYPQGEPAYLKPVIWSDTTMGLTAARRGEVVRELVAPAEKAGLFSAGYLTAAAFSEGLYGFDGEAVYCARTSARCAVTVRDPAGSGSGWAGAASHDWAALDPVAVARRAQEKCVASRSPVAIEPGRYTVVLEPQAVGDLIDLIADSLARIPAENGMGPWADPKRPGFSKLGQKVADERVTVGHDPSDPLLGVCPFGPDGQAYRPVQWIERGVLKALSYDREYAVENFHEITPLPNSYSIKMQGGESTVEQMIATTKRGLLVTRFSGIRVTDSNSLASTGVTRDGLWLIENGKITKPVKNLRFSDSPVFMLNSLEQLGAPVPVFRLAKPWYWGREAEPDRPVFISHLPTLVPPLKARGFNFTRLVDAV